MNLVQVLKIKFNYQIKKIVYLQQTIILNKNKYLSLVTRPKIADLKIIKNLHSLI